MPTWTSFGSARQQAVEADVTAYLSDWASLLVRWIHIIAGIAWIGASFYLVRLDAPLPAPQTLRWFSWQAYSTWLSGVALMGLLYFDGSRLVIAVAILVGCWLVYDRLCRSTLSRSIVKLTIALGVLGCVLAWGLSALLSSRPAFMLFGAVLGTLMVGNILVAIVPAQRNPDPVVQLRLRQRFAHNTYFTLPVLFVMLSLHAAMLYGAVHTWLVLIALTFAGVCIRAWFVAQHKPEGREAFGSPFLLILGLLGLLIVIIGLYPDPGS